MIRLGWSPVVMETRVTIGDEPHTGRVYLVARADAEGGDEWEWGLLDEAARVVASGTSGTCEEAMAAVSAAVVATATVRSGGAS